MKQNLLYKKPALKGAIRVPGDKSISHRSIMFGAIAEGKTVVKGFLKGDDCLSTIDCFKKMGVRIEETNDQIIVHGVGFDGLKEPVELLDVGNSGTTTRLLLGILAGRPFHSVIIGDESIATRPMKRVTGPLREMGAAIDGREDGQFTPISIRGGNLSPLNYELPVASAQLKSAILFAGLQADGVTEITEPEKTRDHTERMIRQFGGTVTRSENKISLHGGQALKAQHIEVPGDISSAAFFLVAGAVTPGSEIKLQHVGVNPTRDGIIEVLEQMGADLHINEAALDAEPVADITIKNSKLKSIEIGGEIIPKLIDEIPVIALLATQAQGTTVIRDAEELKVKETNRIDAVVGELKKLGADIEATDDGMIIHGPVRLNGGKVSSRGDHRIGMMLSVAALLTNEEVEIEGIEAVSVSYPDFLADLESLMSKE
ncbi:3-phosphoshikimate 1-carboxyvinyltransferase [Jeotgalibacillus proteolyticus]|uniref:3-phosphoshikimate 1-carboxyvinyltransferase n=1 Tax=Jeotgalibacillus proteolyticus TaxID=2082395 RepID=A0A2S5GE49_9BACL|nr:3-phosphoshikimate 1-carboxyvinyltransferase [Jeotgalibacillus proteolyticus]PPA71259.1 3-phosphoshikimate 1-carboxyvinyltransferase [Jeotgalibacillus proteolyticus]